MADKTQIEMNGYRELVADHCELCDQVAQLTQRVEQLEYLMSEEIMARLASPAELREVVEWEPNGGSSGSREMSSRQVQIFRHFCIRLDIQRMSRDGSYSNASGTLWCSALMVLRVDNVGCSFVCHMCGAETPARSSVAEADDDVVWVPVTVPAAKRC